MAFLFSLHKVFQLKIAESKGILYKMLRQTLDELHNVWIMFVPFIVLLTFESLYLFWQYQEL